MMGKHQHLNLAALRFRLCEHYFGIIDRLQHHDHIASNFIRSALKSAMIKSLVKALQIEST
jgi:hypothetical protein